MAERNSGSLLWYHQTSKNGVVEMGRSISKLEISKVRSMEGGEQQQQELPPPLTSASSFQRTPTFLKVQKGDPYILTQKSWETINNNNDGASYDDDDTAEYDYDDDDTTEHDDGNGAVIRSIHKEQDEGVSRSRSWNKLRKSIVREERTSKSSSSSRRGFRGIGSSIRKVRGGGGSAAATTTTTSPNNNEGPPEQLQRSLSFAKNSDVEVALSSEKKGRSWFRRRGRRGNKNVPEEKEETPPTLRDGTAAAEEEEGFFVNNGGRIPTAMDQEDDLALPNELPFLTAEEEQTTMSIEEAQSMEIACGFDACSTVDIIGSTLFLKGGDSLFDLNRHDMDEHSFDIVPRRQ
jgi:hypothetical protein